MASVCELPVEIILVIAKHILKLSDLVAFSAANRRLHAILMNSPVLFSRVNIFVRRDALFWAAYSGQTRIARLILDTGVDPNFYRLGPIGAWSGRNQYYPFKHRGSTNMRESIAPVSTPYSVHIALKIDGTLRSYWQSHLFRGGWWATPLHLAAYMGHDDIVGMLIEKGANLSLSSLGICRCTKPDFFPQNLPAGEILPAALPPWSALHLAICGRHISTAQFIISRNAPLHQTSQLWPFREDSRSTARGLLTALGAAYRYGRRVLKSLVGARDASRKTALDYYRHWNCYQWLIAKEWIIQQPNSNHSLHPDWHHCSSDACRLISYGIDVQAAWSSTRGKPLIHVCLQQLWGPIPDWRSGCVSLKKSDRDFVENGLLLLKMLITNGANIEERDQHDHNTTPLIVAARNGASSAVNLLISHGADVNAADDKGYTALHGACVSLNMDIVTKLVENGTRIDATTNTGMSPLCTLCLVAGVDQYHQSLNIIQLLLSHGANPMLRVDPSSMRRSPLEIALMRSRSSAAELLLSSCDSTSSDEGVIWSLFAAVLVSPDPTCLKLVLSFDKQRIILTSDQSLLRLLRSSRNTSEIAILLLDEGAPCDGACAENGGNTIFWAVQNQKGDALLRRLLGGGANPNVIFESQARRRCPLFQALQFKDQRKRRTYVKLLLEYGASIDLSLGPSDDFASSCLRTAHHRLLRKIESVSDLLFDARHLRGVPEIQQLLYLNLACKLTHVRILHTLLSAVSDATARKFRTRPTDAIPLVSLLDVTGYPRGANLTVDHMDMAIDAVLLFTQGRAGWASAHFDDRRRNVDILRNLMAVTVSSTPTSIGAAWCLRRRVSIAGTGNERCEVTISATLDSIRYPRGMKLHDLGLRIRKTSNIY